MNPSMSRRVFMSSSALAAGSAGGAGQLRAVPAADRIKIGQIGVGHAHAGGKMQSYRESAEFEVVGIVESDPQLRERAEESETYRGLKWMPQEELLNVQGLQAVAVETQVGALLDRAEACVQAGMHIPLDKPPGASLPHLRSILKMASEKKLVVQMGYMYRYNPAIVLMRDLLQKGWLGEPFEVHTVMSKVVGPESRASLAEHPGGKMFELGCHITDLVVGALGKPDRVTPYSQHVSAMGDGLADNMLAVCEYPKALATIKSAAQEVSGFARRHFVLCGTEGTCHIQPLDAPSVRLALSTPRGAYSKGYQEITFPKYRRYIGDAADFAKIIRGEKESDFPPEHDEAVQETVLKASGLSSE